MSILICYKINVKFNYVSFAIPGCKHNRAVDKYCAYCIDVYMFYVLWWYQARKIRVEQGETLTTT